MLYFSCIFGEINKSQHSIFDNNDNKNIYIRNFYADADAAAVSPTDLL